MKNVKMFICATLITFLYACEGGTTFTKTLENNSSETLTVTVFSDFSTQSPVVINPGESKEIYWDDQMGRFAGEGYLCTNEFDSVLVQVSNNKTLIKDIMDANNWTRESKDGRNSREDCSFSVGDVDLQ